MGSRKANNETAQKWPRLWRVRKNGLKLVYAKNTKWLLSGPHQRQKFAQ
jgi:hypothetical protein